MFATVTVNSLFCLTVEVDFLQQPVQNPYWFCVMFYAEILGRNGVEVCQKL